jgi:hypothetical protein
VPFGVRNSGLTVTRLSVLPLDLRWLSLGGGGGLDELADRTGSFSMGGGGVAVPAESIAEPSGSCGRSGTTI